MLIIKMNFPTRQLNDSHCNTVFEKQPAGSSRLVKSNSCHCMKTTAKTGTEVMLSESQHTYIGNALVFQVAHVPAGFYRNIE